MLKMIGMLLRLHRPTIRCRSCGYTGVADLSYANLVPWLAIMIAASVLYIAIASVFVWAAFYFSLNWPVGIFFTLIAAYFVLCHSPDLGCPVCNKR